MPDHPTRPLTKNNTESAGTTVRVFFAIWPDDVAQKQLAGLIKRSRLASLCNGRETKPENIHLTLAFLGAVEPHKLEALRVVANGMAESKLRAFDFAVEEIRYWKRKRIVYATPASVPRELLDLVNALSEGLSTAGFLLEQRAYAPHITLMRDASCQIMPELPEPVVWRVREWMLIKSELASDGSVYSPIGRWRLA
jgi:RNA 2',3'-cyclic 3'-phosphodiesterase